MGSFVQWVVDNAYTNVFTLITVVVSGVISVLVSRHYFNKSNTENLKLSIIHPIVAILNAQCTTENFEKLIALEKQYAIKYMPRKEREYLSNLILAYKDVVSNPEDVTNAKILFSYFERCLSSQGIEWDAVPVIINGEIVDCEPPQGYFELEDNIYRIIRKYDYHFEEEKCQETLELLFLSHVKTFCSNQKAVFFKEESLLKIISQDKLTIKRNEQLKKYKLCKTEFLNLPLIKNK